MSSLAEISHAGTKKAFGNKCDSKITLAINAASAATVKTTGAVVYTIDGIKYTKAALSAQALTVTHDCFGNPVGGPNLPKYIQPIGATAYLLLCLNAAGTLAVVQGNYAGQSLPIPGDLSKTLLGTGAIPAEPDGYTAIGLIKVVAGTVVFDPATTVLDVAGLTVSYFDLERIPSVAP